MRPITRYHHHGPVTIVVTPGESLALEYRSLLESRPLQRFQRPGVRARLSFDRIAGLYFSMAAWSRHKSGGAL